MPWTAAAIVGGAVIGAVASDSAAGKQAGAANRSTDIAHDEYEQTRTDNMPALGARNDALARLEALLGVSGKGGSGYGSLGGPINVGDVTQEPGYQFGLQQGQKALENQLAARGMRDSGAGLKAGIRFADDYATTKYNDAFNREQANRQVQINPLQSLAGLGQTGATTMAQAGANYANQAGANARYAGEAAAEGGLAQASIWGNAGNQLAGWYDNYRRKPDGQMPAGWASGPQSSGWYSDDTYGPQ